MVNIPGLPIVCAVGCACGEWHYVRVIVPLDSLHILARDGFLLEPGLTEEPALLVACPTCAKPGSPRHVLVRARLGLQICREDDNVG